MGANWLQTFLQVWLSSIAAVLTVAGSVYGGWKWIRPTLEKKFGAKPFNKIVKKQFTYYDVMAGFEVLAKSAIDFEPEEIVGINRGGAIVGGMLGKELGLVPRIIAIDEHNGSIWFKDAKELKGRKILLVDDRLTHGKHMYLAYNHLKKFGCNIIKLVFTWIERTDAVSKPNIWAYKASTEKFLLPWEPIGGAIPIDFSGRI